MRGFPSYWSPSSLSLNACGENATRTVILGKLRHRSSRWWVLAKTLERGQAKDFLYAVQKSTWVVPSTSITFSGLEHSFYGSASGTHQTWQHPSPGSIQPFPVFFPHPLLCSPSSESHLALLPWHTEMNPKGNAITSVGFKGMLVYLCFWLPYYLIVVAGEGKDFKARTYCKWGTQRPGGISKITWQINSETKDRIQKSQHCVNSWLTKIDSVVLQHNNRGE